MDSDRDLYQILQVDPAAEPEVVQAAFKRLALKYHPDRNQSLDANHRMQEINEAYAVIGDPARRAAYDQQRQTALAAQRRSEEEARHRTEAERRAEAIRQRKEQMAAQRRAENERQEEARAAAAQRRAEYEQQIRAQMAAQRRAKLERQQREREQQAGAQQAAAQAAAPVEMPIQEPATMPEAQVRVEVEQSPIDMPVQEPAAMPEAQVRVEVEQDPIGGPYLSESERQHIALMQSRQALQNEIFKLDYGLADAAEQVEYWSGRRVPWEIVVPSGRETKLMVGGAVTIFALLLAGFTLAFGGGAGWVACGLVGIGAGWWTWRTCVSAMPAEYLVEAWSEIKRSRERQQQKLKVELAQVECSLQPQASASASSCDD